MKAYKKEISNIILDFYVTKICEINGIKKSEVFKKTRKRELEDVKAMVAYLAKKYYKVNYKNISDFFGLRQHGTIMFAIKKIENLRNLEPQIDDVLNICEAINFNAELLLFYGFEREDNFIYFQKIDGVEIEVECNVVDGDYTLSIQGKNYADEHIFVKGLSVFDIVIITKNINYNPIGVLINLLKN
jgi:hypothetical protein